MALCERPLSCSFVGMSVYTSQFYDVTHSLPMRYTIKLDGDFSVEWLQRAADS